MHQVSVIGSGVLEDQKIYNFVKELGRILAENKYVVVCGGKGGVMEAVCKGVKEGMGISVAILPSINEEEANEYAFIKIPTNLGENRNYLIIQSAAAVICIGGVKGTRMEAEYTLKLKKPLITIPNTGGVSQEFTEKYPNQVHPAENIREILDLLEEFTNG